MKTPPTPRALPAVVTRTRNPVRRVFHIVAAILGWLLFAWFWYTVFACHLDRHALATFALLVVVLAGVVLVNFLWVNFNRGIYRTRGRRTRVRAVQFAGVTDQLGRSLEGADWDRLQTEGWIRIELEGGGIKRYTPVSVTRPPRTGPWGGGAR